MQTPAQEAQKRKHTFRGSYATKAYLGTVHFSLAFGDSWDASHHVHATIL